MPPTPPLRLLHTRALPSAEPASNAQVRVQGGNLRTDWQGARRRARKWGKIFLGFLIPEKAEGAYLHPRAWRAFFIRLLTQQSEVRRQLKGLRWGERGRLGRHRPGAGRRRESACAGVFQGQCSPKTCCVSWPCSVWGGDHDKAGGKSLLPGEEPRSLQ